MLWKIPFEKRKEREERGYEQKSRDGREGRREGERGNGQLKVEVAVEEKEEKRNGTGRKEERRKKQKKMEHRRNKKRNAGPSDKRREKRNETERKWIKERHITSTSCGSKTETGVTMIEEHRKSRNLRVRRRKGTGEQETRKPNWKRKKDVSSENGERRRELKRDKEAKKMKMEEI